MSAKAHTNRYRALALVVVAGVAIWSIATFTLASTGTNTASIQPATNLPNGNAADLTAINSAITRPNGNAHIQAGVLIGRVNVAKGFGNLVKVDIAWLDPNDSSQVLNNPNAQVYVGLYHPIAENTSSLACGAQSPSVGSKLIDVTDTGAGTDHFYCAEIDDSATGSLVTSGNLIITATNISGYVRETAGDSSAGACPTTATEGNPWCHPTGLDSGQNELWVALTIVTPGGKPAGQQNNLSSLSFYAQVSAA